MPSPENSVQHVTIPTHSSNTEQVRKTVLETHGYFLGKTIGSGSYATVRMAHSELHGGNVAVKIVSKYTAPDDYLKRFLPREIEVVKGLKHANLIRFLQAIETTHRVYIVMEYADNGSLLDIIRRDSYIDETRACKWFRQLIDAIEYCHERGVVHRDIKCENLLMDSEYNIKVSDFGFARLYMRNASGHHQALSETFCGSYAYASPEILRGIPYQPQLSDVWSIGVVLYAMVFGRLPFDDSNYPQLLKQVSQKVTFPREPKVSHTCRALINKILAPLRVRARFAAIRSDPWFSMTSSTTEESRDSMTRASTRTEPATTSTGVTPTVPEQQEDGEDNTTPIRETTTTLLTKQLLREEAQKKGNVKKRRNSDEETPVATVAPTERTVDGASITPTTTTAAGPSGATHPTTTTTTPERHNKNRHSKDSKTS